MAEANLYLPTVAWRTSISNVILLTEETTELVATYRVTVDPIDINEPGGLTGEAEDIDANNYYLKDFLGHTYKIIDVGTGTVDISDDFRTGHGAVTGRMGIIYKSVGGGTSPYLAPVYYKYLDKSARDYSRRFELDILWKNAGITTIGSEVDPTYPISYIYYIDQYGDKIYVTEVPKPNGLIWGGNVSWYELLKFDVTAALYYLEGLLYMTDGTQVILDPADATFDRIDLIVADDQEVVSVITGVPNANPQKPTIDVTTQIELTQVLVKAGATTPFPIPTSEVIYNENIEWTVSSSGVAVNADSTTEHYLGSKSIDVPAIGNADYIQFDATETFDRDDYENIVANIKLKATMDTRKMHLSVVFLLDDVAVSNPSRFTILGTSTAWQSLLITLSRVTFHTGTEFNQVRFSFFRLIGGDYDGFYLDYIKLESGIVQPPITSSSVQLIGDVLGTGVTGIPIPTTLAIVNANVGQFGGATSIPKITVDAKGRVTAIENVTVTTSGIEDISFDFNDVEFGVAQTWILDIKASFAYKILSVVLQSDSTMDDVTVEIAGSPITWADDSVSIDVTTAVSDTAAKTDVDNDVAVGEQVTLNSSGTDGTPTVIRGKLKIRRVAV